MYIADTHSLLWFLTENIQLSSNAASVFRQAEKGENTIVIPTIVLAEALYICEKKDSSELFSELLGKIGESSNYIVYDLTLGIIRVCQHLEKVPEIHDKIITATAKVLGGTAITKDPAIIASGYIKTTW
ncbi:MAG: PIN domain-containing protein [Candidatus Diapherotrites archaeon]|nr:PIN domain-containing protein [Candidatus Diapherotrites archaeon]